MEKMKNDFYTQIIKKEFLLFLMQHPDNIYNKVQEYIKTNWKENINCFLNKQINITKKPQNILNTAFNFYSTKEGFNYWNNISNEWKGLIKRKSNIREALKIRKKKIRLVK